MHKMSEDIESKWEAWITTSNIGQQSLACKVDGQKIHLTP